MPASGPVSEPKMFPAAVMEDQEAVMGQTMEPVVFAPPPFSSGDPDTDSYKLVPLTDASEDEAAAKAQAMDKSEKGVEAEMSGEDAEAEDADAEDDDGKKAADWKAEVEAAQSQDELDEITTRYSESSADFKTVDKAILDKEDEFQNRDN